MPKGSRPTLIDLPATAATGVSMETPTGRPCDGDQDWPMCRTQPGGGGAGVAADGSLPRPADVVSWRPAERAGEPGPGEQEATTRPAAASSIHQRIMRSPRPVVSGRQLPARLRKRVAEWPWNPRQ